MQGINTRCKKIFFKCNVQEWSHAGSTKKVKKQDTGGLPHHNDAMTSGLVAELY